MAQVEMSELNRAAFLAEVCLLPSKPQKHVLLEWRRLWAIYKHPGFQGFGKPFNKFLWLKESSFSKHPELLATCSAFSAVVILFLP